MGAQGEAPGLCRFLCWSDVLSTRRNEIMHGKFSEKESLGEFSRRRPPWPAARARSQ